MADNLIPEYLQICRCRCGEVLDSTKDVLLHAKVHNDKDEACLLLGFNGFYHIIYLPFGSASVCSECDYIAIANAKTPVRAIRNTIGHILSEHSPTTPEDNTDDDIQISEQKMLCRFWLSPSFWISNKKDTDIRARLAKEVCKLCGLRPKCLVTAHKDGRNVGIWGGVNFSSLFDKTTIKIEDVLVLLNRDRGYGRVSSDIDTEAERY